MKIWSCKIGETDPANVPQGADLPMRESVARTYKRLTGEEPEFIFSGWGAELEETERAVVEDRLPRDPEMCPLCGGVTHGPDREPRAA